MEHIQIPKERLDKFNFKFNGVMFSDIAYEEFVCRRDNGKTYVYLEDHILRIPHKKFVVDISPTTDTNRMFDILLDEVENAIAPKVTEITTICWRMVPTLITSNQVVCRVSWIKIGGSD